MASITPRKNKAGEIISYQIKVSRGRDQLTGKQLTPFTKTYTPPQGWSKKAINRDLQKVAAEFEAACKRGEVLTKEQKKEQALHQAEEDRNKPTFTDYVERYLKERPVDLSTGSLIHYRRTLGWSSQFFGDRKLDEVDSRLLKEFFHHLQTDLINKTTGGKLSYNSVMGAYRSIRALFGYAFDNEIISENPMVKVRQPKRPKDDAPNEPESYSEEEVAHIIRCLSNEPLKWRSLILFLIFSGCRRGEAVGLKWSDIDFETGTVNIERNAQYSPGRGVYITSTKTGQSRPIFLEVNSAPLSALKQWKKEQAELFLKLGVRSDGYCFTRLNGEVLNPGQLNSYISLRLRKKCGMEHLHPHAFRHTMATIMIANGADIVSVSKKLGHSQVSMTLDTYSHANEEAQRRSNKIFDKAVYDNIEEA